MTVKILTNHIILTVQNPIIERSKYANIMPKKMACNLHTKNSRYAKPMPKKTMTQKKPHMQTSCQKNHDPKKPHMQNPCHMILRPKIAPKRGQKKIFKK